MRNLKYAFLNTDSSTTQYPFRIFYLPSQKQTDIVYRTKILNESFLEDLRSTNINNHLISFEKY